MELVRWWNGRIRHDGRDPGASGSAGGGRRDWVFVGFVVFAAGMFTLTGTQRWRLGRALGRASVCLAQADAACAGKGVEDARAIDADHPRVRLADAGLRVLLREPAKASATIAALDQGSAQLPPEARGDLLLLKGDLALARGAPVTGREHYLAARLLVKDPELVEARLRRLDDVASGNDAYFSSVIGACQQLADAAENGEAEAVSIGVREQTPRVLRVADPEIRSKLQLALGAVERAAQEVNERRRRGGLGEPSVWMDAPTEPSRDQSAWAQKHPDIANRQYDQAWESYRRQRDRYNALKDARDRTTLSQRASSDRVVSQSLVTARRLLAEAAEAFARRKAP